MYIYIYTYIYVYIHIQFQLRTFYMALRRTCPGKSVSLFSTCPVPKVGCLFTRAVATKPTSDIQSYYVGK